MIRHSSMKRSRTGESLGEAHSGEWGERGRDSGGRGPRTPKVKRRVQRPVPGAVRGAICQGGWH